MATPVELNEEYVYRVAPDGKSAQAGLQLVQRGAFRSARRLAEGARLEARCQGSEAQPYLVQVDLSNPDQPRTGCDCYSYKRPCKHALGLMFLAIRAPEAFAEDSAPPPRRRRRGGTEVPLFEATAREVVVEKEQPAPVDLEQALLQAVLAEPAEEAPRLIYADWLEENGGELGQARAEFIRVQCELARLPEEDSRCKALRQREKELWKAHRALWVRDLPEHLRRRREIRFHRGFLEELSLPPRSWEQHGEELFARFPIFRLRLTGTVDRHETGALAVIPWLSRIRVVSLAGCRFDEPTKTLQILFHTPFLSGVTHLDLNQANFSTRDITVLVESPMLARLRELNLANSAVGPKGAQTLAAAPACVGLRVLSLANNPLGDGGAKALAASPHLDGLHRLDLSGVPLGEAVRSTLVKRFGPRVLLD